MHKPVVQLIAGFFTRFFTRFFTPMALLLCCHLQADEAPRVTTQSSTLLTFFPEQSAPARVIARNHSQIPARLATVVEQLTVQVGDRVNAGDVLARLDCQDPELALQKLTAEQQLASNNWHFAQREYQRGLALLRDKSISQSALDQLLNGQDSAESRLKSLDIAILQQQVIIGNCTITAPFAGWVTARLANVGEQMTIGQGVVMLLQATEQTVSAQIPLANLDAFNQSREFAFVLNDQHYPLKLRQQLPLVENQSRSVESRFDFVADPAIIGSTGRLIWRHPLHHLPAYLLQKRHNQAGFFMLVDHKAQFVPVATGQEGQPFPLDQNGPLTVIIDGRFSLTDGQVVNPVAHSTAKNSPASPIGGGQQQDP